MLKIHSDFYLAMRECYFVVTRLPMICEFVLQKIKQPFCLERLGDTGLRDALEGLDKDLGRRNEKCPMVYISLLSPPLQQPKLNPAGADRAQ